MQNLTQLQDENSELAVLGIMLMDDAEIERISKILEPRHFSSAKHAKTYEAIVTLAAQGGIPDPWTIAVALDGEFNANVAWLTGVLAEAPMARNAFHFAGVIADLARRRALVQQASELATLAHRDDTELETIIEYINRLQQVATFGQATGQAATWADVDDLLGPITWAWDKWLPNGMLTILASEPGTGKSALALRLAACYVSSAPWPDGSEFTGEHGKVLWCEAEAGQALNLERARHWGLDLTRLLTPLDNPLADFKLDNPLHKQALHSLAFRDDVRLIIVDSLRGIHSGDENSSDLIGLVKWLAELARDSNRPILLTHHLRKRGIFDGEDGPNLDRLRGSSAIVQPARVVWALDLPDPLDKEHKRLSVIKSNLARFPEAVGMRIGDDGVTFDNAPEPPRAYTELDKAVDFLLALLKAAPRPSKEIEEEANGAGISSPTVKRAKRKLGIHSVKKEEGWYWSLPQRDENIPIN
jgi:hypothetical protein